MSSRRGSYLRALGVDQYVSRSPGAAEVSGQATLNSADAAVQPATKPSTADVSDAAVPWSDLPTVIESCRACELGYSRTRSVFGRGNPSADWMIIGEAPGAEEDRQGLPFVGRAGQLLDEMLRAINLDSEQVFIANVLKCRPPNNRDPAAGEIAACRGFLQAQIKHIKPRVILIVGRIAAQALLETKTPVGRLRGRRHDIAALPAPVIVTYHPAYLLRSPAQKARAWQDLKLARQVLKGAAA